MTMASGGGQPISSSVRLCRKGEKRMKRWMLFAALFLLALCGLAFSGASSARADGGDGTELQAVLMGPSIKGEVPKGQAEFRSDDGRRRLKVEVEDVNLANGTKL